MSESTGGTKAAPRNPIVVLLLILLLAAALTYVLDSGSYQRQNGLVVPGSYQTLEKDRSLLHLAGTVKDAPQGEARPVGLADVFMAIPQGLQRGGGLIFMVLIIGGMFGILRASGAVDAGLERMLSIVRGNVYGLVVFLMTIFALGSTFLGLASEYLLIIPLMVEMVRRLGMPPLIGLAIGAYGLTQAVLQIPFGVISDRIGRRPVVLGGLALFVAGSLLGAFAGTPPLLLASRVLQAMGFDAALAGQAIRVSLGPLTTEDEVLRFAEVWRAQYQKALSRAA